MTLPTNASPQELGPRELCLDAGKPPLRDLTAFKIALDGHAIVAVTDATGTITYVNDRFCEISQYSREELIGQNHRIVKSDHHPRRFFVEMWRTVLRGETWHGEVCNRRKDGSLYWLSTTIMPFRDASGEISQFISIRTDITKRKTAEAALIASERQFRALVNNIPGVAYSRCIDGDRQFAFVSPAIESLTGFAASDFIEKCRSFDSVIHPDDAPAVAEAIATVVKERWPLELEYRIVRADGQVRHVMERGQVIANDATGSAYTLDGVIFDISERKEVEQQLLREQQAREERARLASFVRHAPAAIAAFDEQMRYLAASHRWITDYCLEANDVLGRPCYEVLPVAPPRWRVAHQHCLVGSPQSELNEVWKPAADCPDRHLRWEMRPWLCGDGRIGGTVIFSEDTTAVHAAETALRNSKETFERAAHSDALTGLPNRDLLVKRLDQIVEDASRSGDHRYAVLFLDFDRFKLVNDSLGHRTGDALLREIAARLHEEVRGGDSTRYLAGRLGGDEFLVLLTDLPSHEAAQRFAERLLASFSRPCPLGEIEVTTTASVGLVFGDPRYAKAEELIRDADTAMYEAKRAGKNRYVIFDASMRDSLLRRMTLENELRKAVQGKQLWLAYQPIVSLSSGEVKSIEALVRWNSTHGPVSPGEFIPIAEESDLILELGEWVLDEGCRQMRDLVERLGPHAPQTVSINVSRKQFALPNLPHIVKQTIDRHGLPPKRVQLEVTEDFFASDVKSAISAMHAIKALGVKLAIDDFGTGCSSFASLHQFPVDVLKIDRSMLAGIERSKDTAALVHSLAVLVRNLGITLVAEGVETQRQMVALQELGCNLGQGYYFAKPMPVSGLEEYLVQQQAAYESTVGAMTFANRWKMRLPVFESLPPEA